MNTGDFQEVLRRNNINPKYNELLDLISIVNENISKIEDEVDALIVKPLVPATELKLKKFIGIMDRVNHAFYDKIEY
jgi:hypothetical protein